MSMALAILLLSILVVFLLVLIGLGLLVFRQLKLMQSQITSLQTAQTTLSTAQQEIKNQQSAFPAFLTEITKLQQNAQNLMNEWRKDTEQLSRALRNPNEQGVWGERELRRIVELAGMMKQCDFEVKPTLPNGKVPDLVIRMPGNRSIAVDAKAFTQVYQEAIKEENEKTRRIKLAAYTNRIKEEMHDLTKREYWKGLSPALNLTILFLPNEAMFRAALENDVTLFDAVIQKNVLLASPMSLIALLKVIEYSWSQEKRAENVQQVVDRSKDLQEELVAWLSEWQRLREALGDMCTEFNGAAARYEDTILPLLKELGSFDGKLLVKEKALVLKPIQVTIKHLVGEVPGSKQITTQFERWKNIIWAYRLGQKKEDEY